MNNPFISICIPAYKRITYLERLMNSIAIQTYKHFEVIVTDDSNDNEVEALCENYKNSFKVFYYKNAQILNTPENWNEAIRKANGQWIKLMHDDDWFSKKNSLEKFTTAITKHPTHTFLFSAYTNVYENSNKVKNIFLTSFWKKMLLQNSHILSADNVIGPPSATIHKNDGKIWYDPNMKYMVDIDFYIHRLQHSQPVYIAESLINVGINNEQVTKYTYRVANVHLKESLLLLEKTGADTLKNIIVFDGWWRLMRNFSIKMIEDIRSSEYKGTIPDIILQVINFQKNIPSGILKIGVFSKMLMNICYLKVFNTGTKK